MTSKTNTNKKSQHIIFDLSCEVKYNFKLYKSYTFYLKKKLFIIKNLYLRRFLKLSYFLNKIRQNLYTHSTNHIPNFLQLFFPATPNQG